MYKSFFLKLLALSAGSITILQGNSAVALNVSVEESSTVSSTGLTSLTLDFPTLPVNSPLSLQFQNASGVAIGAPVNVFTVSNPAGGGSRITIPPPPLPPGAAGLGNKVVATDQTGLGPDSTKPIVWEEIGLIFTKPVVRIDPPGLPGGAPQRWFLEDIDEPDFVMTSTSAGNTLHKIVESNFDLTYTPLAGDSYQAIIFGDNSFLRLSNDFLVTFENGLIFGTIDVPVNKTTGSFYFSALGLSGFWEYILPAQYTRATSESVSKFNRPGIFVTPDAPVPAPLPLLGIGAAFGSIRKLRNFSSKLKSFSL